MSKAKPRMAIDLASATNIRRDILGGGGYGNPPEHTRFKKGQSGNPAGRASKAVAVATLSATNAMLLAESERLITILENGQERGTTAKEAVVRA